MLQVGSLPSLCEFKGHTFLEAIIEEVGVILSYKYCYYVSGRVEAPRLAWAVLQQRPHSQLPLEEKDRNKAYLTRCDGTPLLVIPLLVAYFVVDRSNAHVCIRVVVGRKGVAPTNLCVCILHMYEPYLHLAWVVTFGFLRPVYT